MIVKSNIPLQRPATTPSVGSASSRSASRSDFAATLQQALGTEKPPSVRELAEMARLQMLHSSLNLDPDDSEASAPPPFAGWVRQLALAGYRPGQTLDTVSASGQGETSTATAPVAPAVPPATAAAGGAGHFEDIIGKAADRFGVAPELIRAVIRAESDFDPRAQSPVGAQGLMQLMPETARDLGVSAPFDPEANILGGTKYLRKLLDRYQGQVETALAAYNWGPGNVDRGNGRLPEETRNYIARIKQFLAEG